VTTLGQYELLLRLGSGGAANVFLVRDIKAKGDDQLVALKVLLPELSADRESLAMFFSEARIAAKLRHPNVVGVTGFGRVEGIHCLAMEYVFGESFGDVLAKSAQTGRPLTVGALLFITSRVCAGLHYAHELADERGESLSLVHRDVTAQNIMIAFDGVPKLADFGIAKAVDRGFETRIGVVKGKFAYMSPEQSMGKKVDRRSDIFCLGIVLWEALTGEVLFEGATPFDSLDLIRNKPIPPPSQVAPGLSPLVDPIVMKALQRAPDDRYQTAEQMGHDVEELLKSSGVVIDNNTLSVELAGIYGAAIPERAIALKAAIAGDASSAILAQALSGEPMSQSQLPVVPGGTSDPDPLGLFSSTKRPSSRARSKNVRVRPGRAFSVANTPLGSGEEPITLDGSATTAQLRALEAMEMETKPRVISSDMFDSWDERSRRHDAPNRLLSLISVQDARERTIPPEFVQHFRGALDVSDLSLAPSVGGVEDFDEDDEDSIQTLAATPRLPTGPDVAVVPIDPKHATEPAKIRRSPFQSEEEDETLRGDSLSPYRRGAEAMPEIFEGPTMEGGVYDPANRISRRGPPSEPTMPVGDDPRPTERLPDKVQEPAPPRAAAKTGLQLRTSTLVMLAVGFMALGAGAALLFILFVLER